MSKPGEAWSSRAGVIMAVAGSAVGLGNFLRFPGLAAQYGGGAFMIAYFTSLILLGIPICWVEWTLGRMGGAQGHHSSPGIFAAVVRHPAGKYLGLLGFLIPVVIYMYYVNIEAWCIGYAMNTLAGNLDLGPDPAAYQDYFVKFTGAAQDGVALSWGIGRTDIFLVIVFIMNLAIIYRGIARGIEQICLWAMPALVLIGLVILVRVLTLGTPDPAKPDLNVLNGLGYMWNPRGLKEGLLNPQLWLAAAGQIFFSLSVGLGVIITYASYIHRNDDVVLSSLTACAANEFCEVGLGGMITVTAAYVFLGVAGVAGMSTFGLGFNVLPQVFARMPWGGEFFGFLFFILLFLAAITSSLSMLQPGIAYLEEGLGIKRHKALIFLGLITAIGCFHVLYFSRSLKALDTMDFWVATVAIFIQSTFLIIVFGWRVGIEKGFEEAHRGAEMRIPVFFKPVIKYVTPLFLVTIFVLFLLANVAGWNFKWGAQAVFAPTRYVTDLVGGNGAGPDPVALSTMLLLATMTVFLLMLIGQSGKRWDRGRTDDGGDPAGGEGTP